MAVSSVCPKIEFGGIKSLEPHTQDRYMAGWKHIISGEINRGWSTTMYIV